MRWISFGIQLRLISLPLPWILVILLLGTQQKNDNILQICREQWRNQDPKLVEANYKKNEWVQLYKYKWNKIQKYKILFTIFNLKENLLVDFKNEGVQVHTLNLM